MLGKVKDVYLQLRLLNHTLGTRSNLGKAKQMFYVKNVSKLQHLE
jgi:hypothetical protein